MSTLEIVLLVIVILQFIALAILLIILSKQKKSSVLDSTVVEKEDVDVKEKQKYVKHAFDPTTLDLSTIKTSEKLMSLNDFVSFINKQIASQKQKSIATTTIASWLKREGLIIQEKVLITKEVTGYSVTEEGCNVGIVKHYDENKKTGETIPTYLLSTEAQKFIIESLIDIYAKKKNRSSKEIVDNVGKRWSKEEEQQLIDEFVNQKLSMSEIAKIHKRKYGGIRRRLMDLGLIEKQYIPYRRKKS